MPKTPLNRAMDMLAVRPLSEAELLTKLLRAGVEESEAENAVARCKELGFLNDQLLAEDSAAFLNANGKGQRLVRQKLLARGLDESAVNQAIEQIGGREEEAAKSALETKLRLLQRESDPRKKREKAFRFLMSRGFSADLVLRLLDEKLSQEEGGRNDE